jgi:ATP-dependent exoDNAse (exonuclease V) beta subunit
VLKQRDTAASELALMKVSRGVTEGNPRGNTALNVVDRSFVADGVRWIIDYKTAQPGEPLATHAERYRPQLERYAELFGEESLPIRAAIFYAALGTLAEISLSREPSA